MLVMGSSSAVAALFAWCVVTGLTQGCPARAPEERDEAINVSAFFVAVGFVLVVIGIVIDPRYRLL